MERDIKLKNHGIVAKACLVEKEIIKTTKGENYEIDVSIIKVFMAKLSLFVGIPSLNFNYLVPKIRDGTQNNIRRVYC